MKGICKDAGVEITELSTHLQGQLVAVHPAYDTGFDAFAPAQRPQQSEGAAEMGGRAGQERRQGVEAISGLTASVSFTGALAFPYLYPWPQRPAGLIDEAFAELGRRWKPILDAYDDAGVDIGFEIHPGEDVFDGATFEMFLDARRRATAAATSTTTRRISCCSSSTISPSSTSITSASRPST